MLRLPQTVTHQQAGKYLKELMEDIKDECVEGRPKCFFIDASNLEVFDSSALAILVHLKMEVIRNGGVFEINDLPDRLSELAKLYGILGLLTNSHSQTVK